MLPIERKKNYMLGLASVLVIGLIVVLTILGLLTFSIVLRLGNATLIFSPFVRWGIGSAYRLARGALSPSAVRRMYFDRRPPILLLRPFKSDGKMLTRDFIPCPIEDVIEKAGCDYGPVVALGRPGESVSAPGAGRLYASQHDWYSCAQVLIRNAQGVIVFCVPGDGLRWELEQLCATRQLDKVVLVPANALFRSSRRDMWSRFLDICPAGLAAILSDIPDVAIDESLYIAIGLFNGVTLFKGKRTKSNYKSRLHAIMSSHGAFAA